MAFSPEHDDALIVVDVQRDFCPGGSLAVPDGDQVVPVVNRLAPRFPTVAVTSTLPPTATQQSRSMRTTTRSSTISRDRSAVIAGPAGLMFRTFHPVRWLR